MKFGSGYIRTSAVVGVLPDAGDSFNGVLTREPDPNRCVVFLLGGHKMGIDQSAEDVVRKVEQGDREVPDTSESLRLLDWLQTRTDLELSYGELDNDLSDCNWRVHQRNGGHNDAEWKLVSMGDTPLDALHAAHMAFCDGR